MSLSLRPLLPFLVALLLLASACNKATPTEVPVNALSPTPGYALPTPTPVPQPASLSGMTSVYAGTLVAGTVECQGKSTTIAADGTYKLRDLLPGYSLVTVTFTASYALYGTTPYTATGQNGMWLTLKPGPNAQDFLLDP